VSGGAALQIQLALQIHYHRAARSKSHILNLVWQARGRYASLGAEPNSLRIGTSAFTAAGWPGTFYPKGLPEREYLTYYATKFDTVEVDSTFYRIPALTTVKGWYSKTPPGFVFAAKVPQIITHDKMLHDCEAEMTEFLKVMDALGEKLGPLLFQFGYFNNGVFRGVNDFLARLRPERANHVWSYDFVSAMTHYGRTLRMLTLIDEYTRECLAIRVARRLGRYEVIEALADVVLCRGVRYLG
jgi:hypothetical protein